MPQESPARKAMKYFFEERSNRKFKGRKRATIITTINRDIQITKLKYPEFDIQKLKSEINLHNIRVKSKNRRLWGKRVKQVVDAAYSCKSAY